MTCHCKWHPGDATAWDNRRVLHAGATCDRACHRRETHKTTFRKAEPIKLVTGWIAWHDPHWHHRQHLAR